MTIIDCKDFPTALRIAQKDFGSKPVNFLEASRIVSNALSLLVTSKNHKYGKDNIQRFGGQGVFMRLWDKIMRLEQHLFKGTDLGEETVMDTWGDVAGYGIVGVMRELGWYDLPVDEK